jgi:hypothetical protein
MAGTVAPNIVTDGLVLYVDAANTKSYVSSSTTWVDIAAGNDVTLTNGPAFNPGNSGYIIFDGTNDFGITNSTSLNILGNVTLNSWIYETAAGSNNGNYIAKSGNTGYRYRREGTNGSPLWLFSSSNTIQGGAIFDNRWYMVTGVFSSTGLRAYINGVLVANNTTPYNPSNVGSFGCYLGSVNSNSELFGGYMASAQIYNRALSVTEILQNYNSTKTRFGL